MTKAMLCQQKNERKKNGMIWSFRVGYFGPFAFVDDTVNQDERATF